MGTPEPEIQDSLPPPTPMNLAGHCWPKSSSDLAVKHLAFGAKGHRFDPIKRLKNFPRINFSPHNIVGG